MTSAVPDILARIVSQTRETLPGTRARAARLEELKAERTDYRDFHQALTAESPAIIAEIKKASPSKGLLQPEFHPAQIAAQYQQGGAAALSVLTDEAFFQGSLTDLEAARRVVSLPVLRKDFTIDAIQILEAAAYGADAILLIAALHDARTLRDLRELAADHGLSALVEVHDEAELEKAIDSGAGIIGVNSRDLRTFQVDLDLARRLVARIPATAVRVAESGIRTAEDVRSLQAEGYQAFLVGEHLMRAGDPASALRALRS